MTKQKFEIDLDAMMKMDAQSAIEHFAKCDAEWEKACRGLKYEQIDYSQYWELAVEAREIITGKRRDEGLMGPAEIKFRDNYEEKLKEIRAHLSAASKEISAAEAIANEYGIPFSANPSPIRNFYMPQSAIDLAKDVDLSEFEDFERGAQVDWGGWEHSEIC